MRGRHHAHVSLLQTGVDFACRLGKLAPRGHVDGPIVDRPVDRAGHDYHHATLGSDDASSCGHDSSGLIAAGYQPAEVRASYDGCSRPVMLRVGRPATAHYLDGSAGR